MKEQASNFGDSQHTQHRATHFGTHAGRFALFNWGWDKICICVLHLLLRCISKLLKHTVFDHLGDEGDAKAVIEFLQGKGVQFHVVSESKESTNSEAHRENLKSHTFVGSFSAFYFVRLL
jgi:hypothetical protein